MIRSGRNGAVKWDPAGTGGAGSLLVASIKGWKLSLKTEKINVTCFADANKVYVPGLPDISGTITGFWNSAELSLIKATSALTPGFLELIPDTTDMAVGPPAAPFVFKGKAYLDAEIDTDVEGAPALSGQILAAGPWTVPTAA